jgi:ADP-ribose pyrophosphatase YjhB (NUDIX family)
VKLAVFRRIPVFLRIYVVRALTPSFHVGAICVIERNDGALLLVRQSYRRREAWGFPGGLLKRGEEPSVAVRREVGEELGVELTVEEPPMVVIEPRLRRVDVIYRARLAGTEGPGASGDPAVPVPVPRSPEVAEVRWFPANDLPILLPEAATALVELARSTRPAPDLPQRRSLDGGQAGA